VGVNRPGRGMDYPPASSAEVKERVELYVYSRSVFSWPVLGWTLLHIILISCMILTCFTGIQLNMLKGILERYSLYHIHRVVYIMKNALLLVS